MEHDVNHATSRSPAGKILFILSLIGLIGALGVHIAMLVDDSNEIMGFVNSLVCGLICLWLILTLLARIDDLKRKPSIGGVWAQHRRVLKPKQIVLSYLIAAYPFLLLGMILALKQFEEFSLSDPEMRIFLSALFVSSFGSLVIFYRHVFGKK